MDSTQDVIDVEFETVTDGGKSVVPEQARPKKAPGVETDIDTEQLAVFGKTSNNVKNKSMPLPIFTLVASICAITAFYFAGGHTLLNTTTNIGEPSIGTAATTQNSVFVFEDITNEIIDRADSKVVSIQATILNKDRIAQVVPPVIVHLGDDPKTRRMFRINRGETLNPGERLVFTNTVRIGEVPNGDLKLSFSE